MYNELYINNNFANLEKHFGIEFEDKKLLVQAFIHPSCNYPETTHYERLEFLGDSILQLIVSDYMYKKYEDLSEGEMSRKRALLVSENAFAYLVRKNTMVDYLLLGKSVKNDVLELSNSYVADIFESFVAAIYLDQGLSVAKRFIYDNHISKIDEILAQDFSHDFKTKLQEVLQQNGPITLKYESKAHTDGFLAELYFDGLIIGSGIGRNKKIAEQQAAKHALSKMVDNESL